jgi:hypothetical protein
LLAVLHRYILETNHSPQLEDTEEDAIKYWSFVKNRLEASSSRPRSLKAVGDSFCAHSSIDAVRFILLAGFTWGSDDMATLAEHLAVFYASAEITADRGIYVYCWMIVRRRIMIPPMSPLIA